MNLSRKFLIALFRGVTASIFRIHDDELSHVPQKGPFIIVMNHINILEIPLMYSHLQPRPVHGMVLADRWKNPLLAWGLDACESIALQRGGQNFSSIHKALEILRGGEILIIMPEGTRSGNGVLQNAHPGVVALALKSKASLLPIVTYGSEKYKENLKQIRRTDFYIQVGRRFTLRSDENGAGSQVRRQMLDEIMYRMAALLPVGYRGAYANLSMATNKYLEFI